VSYVFCAGMHRSGSSVQFQITSDLLESRKIGERKPNSHGEPAAKENWWWACKMHEGVRGSSLMQKHPTAVAVYCYRDVRNVVVSYLRLMSTESNGTFFVKDSPNFEKLMEENFIQRVLNNYKLWTGFGDRCWVSQYENFTPNLADEVRGIARHLKLTLAEGEADEVAARYSVSEQKKRMEQIRGLHANDKSVAKKLHEATRLHPNHIRSEVTDFRTELTAYQISEIESVAGDWLAARGYPV